MIDPLLKAKDEESSIVKDVESSAAKDEVAQTNCLPPSWNLSILSLF